MTRVEQIKADGAPKGCVGRCAGMWSRPERATFSRRVLKGMTGAPSGLYRMFIFVVTTDEHSPTGNEPSYGDAKGVVRAGAAGAPRMRAGCQTVTARHR